MNGLEDHMAVLQELRLSYSTNEEELNAARRVNSLHDEIAQLCQQDEQRISSVIRGAQFASG